MTIKIVIVCATMLSGATAMYAVLGRSSKPQTELFALGGKVKRLSGDHLKLKDGRSVEFAAIRLPYESEPLADEARRTLNKWVADEGIRLQYDELRAYKNERVLAYVYANDTFINERLVRAGLAFVKLRIGNRKQAQVLLEAQTAAREERNGMWAIITPNTNLKLILDEAAASFHLPSCPDVAGKGDLVAIEGTQEVFDRGTAPCGRCKPLEESQD